MTTSLVSSRVMRRLVALLPRLARWPAMPLFRTNAHDKYLDHVYEREDDRKHRKYLTGTNHSEAWSVSSTFEVVPLDQQFGVNDSCCPQQDDESQLE